MQSKPILSLLWQLPKKYRKAAAEHCKNFYKSKSPTIRQETVSSALHCAFTWAGTVEGHDYWKKLHNELENKENSKRKDRPWENNN